MYLFESVIDIVEGQARILFVKLPYTLSTEEAERIGKPSLFSIYKKKHEYVFIFLILYYIADIILMSFSRLNFFIPL